MSELLLLTPQLPYPPLQGTSLRNFHIIRGLADRHRISLLSFQEDGLGILERSPLNDLCQQVIVIPTPQTRSTGKRLRQMISTGMPDMSLRLDSRALEIKLKRILSEQRFDIVQIEAESDF